MKLTKTGRSRLLKLSAFLDALTLDQFDFTNIVTSADSKNCGTVCCAFGWTPAVFPRLVRWGRAYGELVVKPVGGKREEWPVLAGRLFGIPSAIAEKLLTPLYQRSVHTDLQICGFFASPQEVASMLRAFIELADAGKIE